MTRRSSLVTRDDLADLGEWVRDTIRARSARGLGADGRRLPRREDGSPSRLRDTGRLLDSITVEATDDGVTVRPTVDYARHVEAGGRPFVGLTPAEQRQLDARFEAVLDRRERELDRRRGGRR